VSRIIADLAGEGDGGALRGRELDEVINAIEGGGSATLRGVKASGGLSWRWRRAMPFALRRRMINIGA
ncbi:MAG: hypothetical protein V4773_13290, partial [Verrucomicrobiota bacterium]